MCSDKFKLSCTVCLTYYTYHPCTIVPLFSGPKYFMFIYVVVYYFRSLASLPKELNMNYFLVQLMKRCTQKYIYRSLEFYRETDNVLGLTPNSGMPFFEPFFHGRLPKPYRTSSYTVDDDMIIGLTIHHHQLISRVCFIAVSYSHRIVYILVYIKNSEV